MIKIIKKIIFILFFLLIGIIFFLFFYKPVLFLNFNIGKDEKTIWITSKYFPIKKPVAEASSFIDDIKLSPNKEDAAYFDYIMEKIYEKEWALKVINIRTFKNRTVFIGDHRTSWFEWINNDTIRVYLRAGSGVRIYRDINIYVNEPFIAFNSSTPEYWTSQKTF